MLKALLSVNINLAIFDSLVTAFLSSSEEIQQITYPQILGITETIAKEPVHSNQICKFISGLLFTTIKNSVGTTHEKVAFSICSGWIDILMS